MQFLCCKSGTFVLAPLLAQCLTPGLAPLPGLAPPTGGPAWPGPDQWPGDKEDGGDFISSLIVVVVVDHSRKII